MGIAQQIREAKGTDDVGRNLRTIDTSKGVSSIIRGEETIEERAIDKKRKTSRTTRDKKTPDKTTPSKPEPEEIKEAEVFTPESFEAARTSIAIPEERKVKTFVDPKTGRVKGIEDPVLGMSIAVDATPEEISRIERERELAIEKERPRRLTGKIEGGIQLPTKGQLKEVPLSPFEKAQVFLESKIQRAELRGDVITGTAAAAGSFGLGVAQGVVLDPLTIITQPKQTFEGLKIIAKDPGAAFQQIGASIRERPFFEAGRLVGFGRVTKLAAKLGKAGLAKVTRFKPFKIKVTAEKGAITRISSLEKVIEKSQARIAIMAKVRSLIGKEKIIKLKGVAEDVAIISKVPDSKFKLTTAIGRVKIGKGKKAIVSESATVGLSRDISRQATAAGFKFEITTKIGKDVSRRAGRGISVSPRRPTVSVIEPGGEFGIRPIIGETRIITRNGKALTRARPELFVTQVVKQFEIGTKGITQAGFKFRTGRIPTPDIKFQLAKAGKARIPAEKISKLKIPKKADVIRDSLKIPDKGIVVVSKLKTVKTPAGQISTVVSKAAAKELVKQFLSRPTKIKARAIPIPLSIIPRDSRVRVVKEIKAPVKKGIQFSSLELESAIKGKVLLSQAARISSLAAQAQKAGLQQVPKVSEDIKSMQDTKVSGITGQTVGLKQAPKISQLPKQATAIRSVLASAKAPVPSIRKEKPILELPEDPKMPTKKRVTIGHHAFVRQAGRKKRITQRPLPKAEADRHLKYVIENSTAASGVVEETNIKVPANRKNKLTKGKAVSSANFTKSKNPNRPNYIVEKRGKRINTQGEKVGLSAARLLSKLKGKSKKRRAKR